MKRIVEIVTIKDIKDFVNTAIKYGDQITVKTGQYVVPACSLMGMMSLDLTKPFQIVFDDSLENSIDDDFKDWIQ